MSLQAVLKDDTGIVCSDMETEVEKDQQELKMEWPQRPVVWSVYPGDIPGKDEMKMRLVKRV